MSELDCGCWTSLVIKLGTDGQEVALLHKDLPSIIMYVIIVGMKIVQGYILDSEYLEYFTSLMY